MESLVGLLVTAKVLLAPNEHHGYLWAEMHDFSYPLHSSCLSASTAAPNNGSGSYLFLHVLERVGQVDSKADKDDMRVGIGERPETIIVLLSGGIPECEFNTTAIDLDIRNVVLEYGGYVVLWECSL